MNFFGSFLMLDNLVFGQIVLVYMKTVHFASCDSLFKGIVSFSSCFVVFLSEIIMLFSYIIIKRITKNYLEEN